MSRYRWAFSPRWILSHLFVLACIAAFLYASAWQRDRLQGRRESNAVIQTRENAPPVPVQDAVAADVPIDTVGDSIFRQVTVTGTYRAEDQVLIRNRTNHGAPGYWVVTPVVLPGGRAVAVNRGWLPLTIGDGAPQGYQPPSGPVVVQGMVRATQRQEGIGISDPPDGRLATLSRVDVERLQKQVQTPLYPIYVQLSDQQPPPVGGLPAPVMPPELDDGSHLNYMGQWLIFALLTIIVYPLLLRRTARNKQADATQMAIDAGELDDPHPHPMAPSAGSAGSPESAHSAASSASNGADSLSEPVG